MAANTTYDPLLTIRRYLGIDSNKYLSSVPTIFDPVLTAKLSLKMIHVPPSLIPTGKTIVRHRITPTKKGTAEHAEWLDLAKIIHCLEKLIDFDERGRKVVVDVLNDALSRQVITESGKEYILTNLSKKLEQLHVDVENKFTKPKTEVKQ
ncbi:hypothetical protein [Emticicia sp. BO119]|uniref:hypothetical protein n=1 Tax=Emticicia sp. BO119 TaxID=2757768 RepID=UPI0015F0BE50|nr:hypothetical protein [Emticicia sp. BO119]MBA4849460.1 hypothetical protein [Emticicia sp. BO119]